MKVNNSTIRFIFYLAVILICTLVGRFLSFDQAHFQHWMSRIPTAVAGFIFVIFYLVLTTLVWVGPNDILRITSAVLFGPLLSTVFVYVAEMIQAGLFFHLSRKFGRGFIQERFKLKTRDLDKVKGHSGYLGIFSLRINPLIPYRFLDLAYGLSVVAFRKYFTVALVASFPRIFWLQFLLAAVGSSLLKDPGSFFKTMTDYLTTHPTAFIFCSLYLLFVLVVSIFAGIMKISARAQTRGCPGAPEGKV